MDDSTCVACRVHKAVLGVLCEPCTLTLSRPERLCAEQIVSRGPSRVDGSVCSWLVDVFGRPHSIEVALPSPGACGSVVLGRSGDCTLSIADGNVSQVHAELVFSDFSGSWYVLDRGSSNRITVNGDVTKQSWLEPGDHLALADIGFYFFPIAEDELDAARARLRRETLKQQASPTLASSTLQGSKPTAPAALTLEEADGGGLAHIDGRTIQLSVLELELLGRLQGKREADGPGAAAGFVPSRVLTAELSFETARPSNNHLKALIRRTRNKFAAQGVSDIIESRMGLGYRLLVDPSGS